MDQLAQEHLRHQRFAEAEPLYRRLLEEDNSDWVAHLGMARCCLHLYGFPKANPHFQELARLAPLEAAPAYLARGEYSLQQGVPLAQAAVWFVQAALLHQKKGETEQFRAVCRRALELGLEPIEAQLEGADHAPS